jgi:hypothetical protein
LNFQKIKTALLTGVKTVVRAAARFFLWGKSKFDVLYSRLPIEDKYKRILSMTTLSVLLVVVVAVCVPVAKTVGEAVGSAVVEMTGESSGDAPSGAEVVVSAPELENVLPETMETPQNDLLSIPTGGAAWRFTDAEVYRLQRMMVFLEKCDSFEYGDANKDKMMALTAFRYLIERGSKDVALYDGNRYSVKDWTLQKWISGFFGRNLSSKENLGNIFYTGGYYQYTEPNPGPQAVTGYITGAYSLGQNYYKITGIVSRGFADDSARYSRRLSVVLLKDASAEYGYYIISLVNEPTAYTYIDSLERYRELPYEDFSAGSGGAAVTSRPQTTVGGESSLPDDTEETVSDTSAEPETTSQAVSMPSVTEELKKTSLPSAEEKSLKEMLSAMPALLVDFDSEKAGYDAALTLLSHLVICQEKGVDFSVGNSSTTYAELAAKSAALFGKVPAEISAASPTGSYTIEPYLITGKSEYKITAVYDLGSNRYLLQCEVQYFSNPLLSEADQTYRYTAVIERSESAQYKFFIRSQTFVKQ